MRLRPGVRYFILQKGKTSVTNFFYHYVKEIRLSLSLEDSYRAKGGFCSDFIGRKQVGTEPTGVQTISKEGS